jgi:hypothetical protein
MGQAQTHCNSCGTDIQSSRFSKLWLPTSSKIYGNTKITAYYGHCCGCKKSRVVSASIPAINDANVAINFPQNNKWNHCCKCNMDYPYDGTYWESAFFGKNYSYVHCCDCKIVYDHESEGHCCECGSVYDARLNHVCKK